MSNTFTSSAASTFTLTDARYLASKVKADLLQMNRIHGQPSSADAEDFAQELAVLLASGFVDSVSYGFEKGETWITALHYSVRYGGARADERPGRVPLGNTDGAVFTSFLRYSQKWSDLSPAEQQRIKSKLPIQRVSGTEPRGAWSIGDRSYTRHDVSLGRRTIG